MAAIGRLPPPSPLARQRVHFIAMSDSSNIGAMASTIWSTFELLRGRYQRHQYGQIILPFVVLRRLDCVLEPTKAAVLKAIKDHPDDEAGLYAQKAAKHAFWNRSNYTFETLGEDTANLRKNLINYVEGFSDNIQDVFTHYKIEETINELNRHGILLQVFQKFAAIDLHPEVFSNHDMADLFEKLISMDAESANLEAGEYFTPRDVIRLMIDILITPDADVLTKDGVIRTVYDPTAGTGGMLSLAEEHILRLNPKAKISVFGQELNERTYSICKADMLVKGQDVDNIRQGDTLAQSSKSSSRNRISVQNAVRLLPLLASDGCWDTRGLD